MTIEPICSIEPSADLATHEICTEIERLIAVEQQVESRLCDHLAELADRFDRRAPELTGYASIYQFSLLRFGLSVRCVRERVRIGRALRRLPLITQAFTCGELGYAKVREVTRVDELAEASPEREAAWLAAANELPLRALERRVAEASEPGAAPQRSLHQAESRSAGSPSIELRLQLSPATFALLERAMAGARHVSGRPLSDAEALDAVARDALASQALRGHGHLAGSDATDGVGMTPGGHPIETKLSEAGTVVLSLMSSGVHWHPDELQARCDLGAAGVSAALTELEIGGLVHNGFGGYQRVRPVLHA